MGRRGPPRRGYLIENRGPNIISYAVRAQEILCRHERKKDGAELAAQILARRFPGVRAKPIAQRTGDGWTFSVRIYETVARGPIEDAEAVRARAEARLEQLRERWQKEWER